MYGSYYNYMDTWYMDKLLLIRLNLYLNLVLSVEEWTERNREEIGLEIQSYQVILEAQNTYTSITHSFFFSTISIISVTDMKHSLICSYFIGFVGVFFVQTALHF